MSNNSCVLTEAGIVWRTRLMKVLLSLFATLFMLCACGPDSDLVASGKIHSCDMIALQAQLQANPTDTGLQAQLREKGELLNMVIQSSGEGDRAALHEAIQAAVAEGCD